MAIIDNIPEVVKDFLSRNNIRILGVGAAGSGKDYFKDFLHNNDINVDVSYTTRPMRQGEIDGYTYNYITEEVFKDLEKKGKLYEAVSFNNWYYGTSMDCWKKGGYFIMTPSGVYQITEQDLENTVIVYFDIDEDTRRDRISKRSDADSVERRIAADKKDFEGFKEFCEKHHSFVHLTDANYNPEELLYKIFQTCVLD